MKFSFRKLMMALVLPMAVAMVSCNNDDPSYSNPSLTVGSRIMTFTKDGGSNTFDINANRSWTITSSETWLVVSPASNDNKTGVETKTSVSVTATANESGPRSANLTISSPALTEPIVIKVSQEGEGATPISEVVAAEAGGVYTVKATVVGVTEKSFVITDNSGSMLVYKAADPGVAIGDIVEVKGTTSSYNNLIQFAKDELVVTPAGHNDNFTQPTPEEMDGEAFTAYASAPSVKYVTLSAKYTLSENNGKTYHNFSVTGSGNRGSFQDVPASMLEGIESGDAVIATGYMIGAYNTNNYMVLVEVKADEGYVEPDATVATVADVLAGENGSVYEVAGTVGAVTKKSFILVDASGALNIYVGNTPKLGDADIKIGDNVTVEGTRDEYQNSVQLASPTVAAREGEAVALPATEEIDAAGLDAYIATPTIKRVKVAGTYSVSGSYYNLNIDGLSEAAGGSFYQTLDSVIGDIQSGASVIVDGYLVGYNNGKYINIHAISMEKNGEAPEPEEPNEAGTYTIMTEAPADYSGSYFMAVKNKDNKWMMLTGVNSNQGVATEFTVESDSFEANSSQVASNMITIAKIEGKETYTIKLGDKYLYWRSGNNLYSAAELTESYEWTISGAGVNGVVMGVADRVLYYNEGVTNGKPFRCYTDKSSDTANYHNMTLFQVVAE